MFFLPLPVTAKQSRIINFVLLILSISSALAFFLPRYVAMMIFYIVFPTLLINTLFNVFVNKQQSAFLSKMSKWWHRRRFSKLSELKRRAEEKLKKDWRN